jgi:hypothetical protein
LRYKLLSVLSCPVLVTELSSTVTRVSQVRNHELFYEAINFYLDEHPLALGKLLQVLTTKLDHARVVHQLRKADQLPLILPFMKSVQKVCFL